MTEPRLNEDLVKVGARIRGVREQAGLSLQDLARLCGISGPALSSIETGKRDLRVTSLLRIASALRVRPTDLLEDGERAEAQTRSGNSDGYDLGDYL